MFQNARKWDIIYTVFASAFGKLKIHATGGSVFFVSKELEIR
jgi:hypothetical protein